MSETKYAGWKIRTGFLTGNLGDMGEHAGRYSELLEAELKKRYPGAEVEIRSQAAEGSRPHGLKSVAFDATGEEQPDEEDSIWGAPLAQEGGKP